MKKKNILLAGILGISLGFYSCSDYLSVERYFNDRQSEERIFKSRDYTEQWLANAYSKLLGNNLDMAHRSYNVTNYSDDMIFNEGDNGKVYRQFKFGEYSYSWQNSYYQSYTGIRQASILINNVDINEDFTPDEIADVKAQGRFIRAYLYWVLLKKYGPIPILPDGGVDYDVAYEGLSYPRNTYDECADYIAEEMKLAAKDLPKERDNQNITRPTRGAALAVRAKALLYAASPINNPRSSDTEKFSDFTDDEGRMLMGQEYDNFKWAKAAAAALDVIKLNRYKLYTAPKRKNANAATAYAYPKTINPPFHQKYSTENFPKGWADIDPFESYRSLFNGELYVAENPEIIFTRGDNSGSGQDKDGNITFNADYTIATGLVKHQMPRSFGGYNCHGITGKQCDTYYMNDGSDFDRAVFMDTCAVDKRFVSKKEADSQVLPPLREGVWKEYANREPRFYASVAFNGALWPMGSAKHDEYRNQQVWYYRGDADGYVTSSEQWMPTGIGVMKFVNPMDSNKDGGFIKAKADPVIRYADILLMYAEALNELDKSYSVESWDGSTSYNLSRKAEEMSSAVSQVRIRAGLPDFEEGIYNDANEFRKFLKRERQIEFFAENQRYYDLRRWKDAPVEESQEIMGCNAMVNKKNAELFYYQVPVPKLQAAFSRKMYFWAIDYDELKKNIHMTQAPGWETYD